MSKKLILKGSGVSQNQKKFPETITHKIFKTISGFYVKQRITGKVEFLFFESFLVVLTKLSFWKGE